MLPASSGEGTALNKRTYFVAPVFFVSLVRY